MKAPKFTDYFLVALQVIFLVSYFWLPLPVQSKLPKIWEFSGIFVFGVGAILIIVACIQLNRHLSIWPTPSKNAVLITGGVFKFVRHPIYSGIFILALGYALYLNSFDKLFIAFIILLFFEIKSNYEENRLEEKFPEYAAYQKRTGKFFPFTLKSIPSESNEAKTN